MDGGQAVGADWSSRRKVIHEEIFQSPMSTHCFIADLDTIHGPTTTTVRTTSHRPSIWLPPSANLMKLTVDAAISRDCGFGAVRRYAGTMEVTIWERQELSFAL